MTREDFVLAYFLKNTHTIYCRICMIYDIHDCDNMFLCEDKQCCCRSFQEANTDWIKFNNQEDIPLVFSDGSCFLMKHNLCNHSSCNGKLTECDFII